MKKKVLILAGYYLPGIKGGGPIRSIKNLISNFQKEIEFYIIANDRDLGDNKPYDNIEKGKWIKKFGSNIYYTNLRLFNVKLLKKSINSEKIDILYLNSFFSFQLSILPIIFSKLRIIRPKKIVLATRGNFSEGALKYKSLKKKFYMVLSKFFKLYKDVTWHATNNIEANEIKSRIDNKANIIVANNLTENYYNMTYKKKIEKKSGKLKLVYISRIHPVKNLLQTLKILNRVEDEIEFNIYGPIENEQYWEKCTSLINNMRDNIQVNYQGIVQNDKVNDVYNENHIAILMTLGENFGHSIIEALVGGCPVVISDRTPWKKLDKYNAGYEISLDNEDRFIEVIEEYCNMDEKEYNLSSMYAFEYAKNHSNSDENIKSYLKLFEITN